MDISSVTGGRFSARITEEGTPLAFERDGDVFAIRRERGSSQRIDVSALGLVAACAPDGRVLGYGTVAMDEIGAMADLACTELGAREGGPLARLAAHGLVLVAPLDEMPQPLRDMFLAPLVPSGLVAEAGLDDELVAEAVHGHHHHEHRHHHHDGEDCAACASPDGMDGFRARIEEIVAESGHAVVTVPPSEDRPGMTYSVGLLDAGWPEIVMTGIVGEQGLMIVNAAVDALRRAEMRPAGGMLIERAVNVTLKLRALEASEGREYARVASERHARTTGKREGFEVVQLLWPDARGRFPDEDGYDGEGLPDQRLIGGEANP